MRAKGKKLLLALLLICGIMAAFAGCAPEDPTNEEEPVTYKITYVLNGGEGAALGAFEEGIGLSSLPVPTKAGNTFAGWYTTSDFSGEAVTSIAADAVSDVTLYAKWTPNTYSVTYSNLAGDAVSLTEGASEAVYGTDYSFTLVETGEIPATVLVSVGGSPIDVQPVENVYTIEGEEIVGDISVTVSVSHVKVTYRQAEHVSYGESGLLAEKNAPFTFTVNAEQGYVITEVSVTQEGGSPVPVTGENGTYSFAVTDKAITVSATVRAVRYTIEFDNGEETFAQTLSAEYGQDVTLTDVGSLDGFVPEHYTFEGWSLTPNGEKAYDDGATVRNLTVIDGDTVTLYAVLTAEQFTVTVGETSGFELSDLPEATYGQDYVVRISDADSYVYDITAKIGTREQKLEYDDVRGVFVLDTEYVTDDIAISGEKYVADPAVYENVTPYVIADQFGNGNEYKVYATLTEEGILFRLDAKQHSLHRDGGENVLFSDGIRFQLGRKDGSAKSSAGQYFGVNVDGYIGGTDTNRAVAKVSGESGAYEYTLEGLMPVSAILNADLGYTAADFSAENLADTRVYVGMLIINFNNHKSYQDTVYSPNAQYRYSYNGSWGMPVGEIGKGTDDAANTSIISVDGIESAIAKDGVDGVISENEYGSHALEYTNGSNANYMKLYGKRTDDGMYLAVQVRTNTVVYFNGASPSGCPDIVDYMQFGWYSPTYQKYVNYRLYPDGHIADSDNEYDYFLKGLTTAVLIDKSNAGSFTTKTQGNAAGLVAGDNGYFVTTYEIYIPNGIMDLPQQSDGSDVYSDLYVLFRHRCDQIGESGDTNAFDGKDTDGGTIWFYTNGEKVGAWPEQPYATVTPDGIFDLNRTFLFDNTATGNTEQTFSEMAVKAYSEAVLPVPKAQIGYRFVGWATEPNGEPIDTAGGVPLVGKPDSEGKVTLYAVYEEAKYAFSVTDENGLISDITGVTDGNTVLLGQEITFRIGEPAEGVAIVTVTIGGIEYPIEPKDGLYTIAGEAVTGDIAVTVTVTQSDAYAVTFDNTDSVTFSGNTEAYPDVDYRFTADVTAEDYYLAVIVTDADGSVIPVEKINETTYLISGAEIAGDITITEKPHEILSGTFDFELAGFTYGGVASPASAVLIDGEDYSAAFRFSDGQYTVAENALAALSVGQTYRLIMETEDKVYEQQFLFVTMVINDLDEFRLIQSKYYKGTKAGQVASTDTSQYRDGYFVLAADINKGGEYFEFTMSPGWTDDGTGAPSGDEMARLGWYGTLDGRGHAIYNVQAGAGGMFGILTSQSVLKNVAVIGGKTVTGGKFIVPETGEEHANSFAGANAKNTGFFTRAIAGGTVSNVYIEMADMPQIDRFGTLAFIVKGGAHLEKIIIRICASSVSATDRHAAYGLAYENSVADSLYVFGAVQNGAAGSAKADETPYLARNFDNLVAGYDVYGVGSYSELYVAKEDALTSFGSVWDFTENSVSFGSYVYTEEVV